MKGKYKEILLTAVLGLMSVSCRPVYEIVSIEGQVVPMDATWEETPDSAALALLNPYKQKLDSMMQHVVGETEYMMESERPESLLSNLVADVLREAATEVLGKPADMGLVNVGGIRSSLSQGEITIGNIYEILPFENSLCVLTVKGDILEILFKNVAAKGGNGVSGVSLEISRDGKLINGSVAGVPLDKEKYYTVATIDYLAEGNDGMEILPQAISRECPPNATLRSLFMQYVERQTALGKKVTSRVDGRIKIVENK